MAMAFGGIGAPLRPVERTVGPPERGQIVVRVAACGVCRTDLHVIDGDLPDPKPQVIPGHEIVGRVTAVGPGVDSFKVGDRVGIPWLGATCGRCRFCRSGRENLCERPGFTGYTIDGGYAQFTTANASYAFKIPQLYSDAEAAPLLCAGLIGYRAWKLVRRRAASAFMGSAPRHISLPSSRCSTAKRSTPSRARAMRRRKSSRASLAHKWAGASDEKPPQLLDAAIIFAPVGPLVPLALAALDKGGTLVLGGIHMTDIPAMPYALLWGERVIRSVANLTRQDAVEFLKLAPRVPIRPHVTTFALADANDAIARLRAGKLTGAAVLIPPL